MTRLRFGTFLAPFHAAGENPTSALQRDLRLVEHLDHLGFDEAWANPEATRRSSELIAQHVMPRLQGHTQPSLDAAQRASSVRSGHVDQQNAAVVHVTEKYQKELADRR